MKTEWQECLLGDVITLQRGFDLPERERLAGIVPIVSSSGITGYHCVAKVKAPGVVTGRYGTLGEIHYVTKDFWPLNTTLFVKDFKGNHPRFIGYFLHTLNFSSQNVAGAVPGVNRNYLHLLPVQLPPLHTQHKIAAILSAYDDLIENNTCRIHILEDMAQAIYREWFVHFRFPGHEQVRMVESEMGMIPEGWEVKKLKELCEKVDYGYTASADSEQIGPKFLRITDIVPDTIDWNLVPYCTIPEEKIRKFRLQEGDIVIARIGATVGYAKRIGKRHPESIFASYLVRIRIGTLSNSCYVSQLVVSDIYKCFIKSRIGGAAQPQANAQVLTSFPILLPPKDIQNKFVEIADGFLGQIDLLQTQNTAIRRTRDLLLPKLISGEIDVENLDIQIKESPHE
jgi:type I restriction enzyme S subunit